MASLLIIVLTLVLMDVTSSQTTYPLRLVEGSSNYGRLEILYDGEWGTVCDDNFGLNDARVACRQLGLDTTTVNFYPGALFGDAFGQIWLDDVNCGGTELSLSECSHSGFGIENCGHDEDVGISCGVDPQNVTTIRLVGGSSNYGRLEIMYDGEWGTVCDDSFGLSDARVACRQLGLDTATVDYYPRAYFGQGTGRTWLDNVDCLGSELSLASCSHNGFGIEDCGHDEDVGVSCGVANVDRTTTSSDTNGGSIAVIVFFVVGGIFLACIVVYRRRRLHAARQRQTTTTTIQPPSTTVVGVAPASQGTQPLPTYYPGTQPPPPGGSTQPDPSASAGGYAYPPQSPPGQQNPATYPAQTYHTAPNTQTYPAAYPPAQAQPVGAQPGTAYLTAPAQPLGAPPGAAYPMAPAQPVGAPPGVAYPPPQTGNLQSPPTNPAYDSASVFPSAPILPGQERNLPSQPPAYDDVVKQ